MLRIILILLVVFCFIACTTEPGDRTDSVSGVVNLEGRSDHSGITVALYELSGLEPLLSGVIRNQSYNHIGVRRSEDIEQQIGFDHRLYAYSRKIVTGSDGRFSFTGLAPRMYNLVFLQECQCETSNSLSISDCQEFSLKYKLNVSNDIGVVNIKPIWNMDNGLPPNNVFRTGVQHIFPSRTTIISNPFVVEPGAILSISAVGDVVIITDVEIADGEGFWWLTSLHGLNQIEEIIIPNVDVYFNRMYLSSNSKTEISNAKITFTNMGLNISASDIRITNSIFNHNINALRISEVDGNVEISNTISANSRTNIIDQDSSAIAFFITLPTYTRNMLTFENNISFANQSTVHTAFIDATVRNNYFINNDHIALRTGVGEVSISNNNFKNNRVSYSNRASNSIITFNDFFNDEEHDLFSAVTAEIIFYRIRHDMPNGRINNNNFHNRFKRYITIWPFGTFPVLTGDLNCTNNYFFNQDITRQIWDARNDSHIGGLIQYIPRINNQIEAAGIRI